MYGLAILLADGKARPASHDDSLDGRAC